MWVIFAFMQELKNDDGTTASGSVFIKEKEIA